jgi:cis-3-alkyl-4-acyloxetan-2-one decarboxylase
VEPPPIPGWIVRQLPPDGTRRFFDVGGPRMHVMEWGSGRPVLLQHGNPTWGFLYRKVVTALAGKHLRLVVPDLVGLGFSDKPGPAAHTLDNHARWLGTLLDQMELEGVLLVAHDWGGPIGLCALADHPDRLTGLVVLNTVVSPPRPGFRPPAFHRLARLPLVSTLLFRGLGFPQRALHRVQGDPASIRGEVARAYRFPLDGLARNAAPLALARMVPDSMTHPSIEPLRRCQELVEGFAGSAAIVWGDRDPVLGRVRTWIEKLLPKARVTRTSAGHFLQEEVPDEIASAIRFVAGV